MESQENFNSDLTYGGKHEASYNFNKKGWKYDRISTISFSFESDSDKRIRQILEGQSGTFDLNEIRKNFEIIYINKSINSIAPPYHEIRFLDVKNEIMFYHRDTLSFCQAYFNYSEEKERECGEIVKKLMNSYAPFNQEKNYIELVSLKDSSFQCNNFTISKIDLDIHTNYNHDFPVIYDDMVNQINSGKWGISLLYGNPGTGKTTLLRHLTTKLTRPILYLPSGMSYNINNPNFISFLASHNNRILLIEDAEELLKDRKIGGKAELSSLLNISDGLLGDILKTPIICTFNCSLEQIDKAFLRKGRLMVKYEFKPLTKEKVRELANKLELDIKVDREMTLAEIYNYSKKHYGKVNDPLIGFNNYKTVEN